MRFMAPHDYREDIPVYDRWPIGKSLAFIVAASSIPWAAVIWLLFR